MKRINKLWFTFLLLYIVLILVTLKFSSSYTSFLFKVEKDVPALSSPVNVTKIHRFSQGNYNHASTMATNGDDLYVSWYGGPKEHVPAVSIFFASGKTVDGKLIFSKTINVVDQSTIEVREGRHIHTLGNPILYQGKHKLWLFFVTTFGGWATSSINQVYSTDGGQTWSDPKMVITSALFNMSTLTRGNPIKLQGGLFAIPMYYELATKSGIFIVFNEEGEVVNIREMSWNTFTLQPLVIPLSSTKALAFFRRAGHSIKKAYYSYTNDGGYSWSDSVPTILDNPDSGISAFRTKSGIAMIYNNETDSKRSNLSIATSSLPYKDEWHQVYSFSNPKQVQMSYPFTIIYKGSFYLSYSADSNHAIELVKLK
ncbi:MAG: putative neuraminidase [Francisellaceae bacterium]|jgi:predicted neuraminidase